MTPKRKTAAAKHTAARASHPFFPTLQKSAEESFKLWKTPKTKKMNMAAQE
jgi:hypothetical protein